MYKSQAAPFPIAHGFRVAMAASLFAGLLIAGASSGGLILGSSGLYGDPKTASSATPSTAGLLVPGLLGHDVFNLLVALPLLLATVWLAWRGSSLGLLLLPGVLVYVLYTYTIYLITAPFSALFLPHVGLVALS